MADVINRIFSSLQDQFVGPLGDNLMQFVGPVWFVAFIIAVLALVFGFGSPQRGLKIGVLAALAIFGFVWFGFGSDIVQAITGNASLAAGTGSEAPVSAAQQAGDAAEGVRQIAQASLKG